MNKWLANTIANGGNTAMFARTDKGEVICIYDCSSYTSGYQVSIRDVFTCQEDEAEDIATYYLIGIMEQYFKDYPEEEIAYLGTWLKDGTIYVDVSTRIDNLLEAIKVGANLKQQAIWDWANQREISLVDIDRAQMVVIEDTFYDELGQVSRNWSMVDADTRALCKASREMLYLLWSKHPKIYDAIRLQALAELEESKM